MTRVFANSAFATAFGGLVFGMPAQAHHALGGTVDTSKQVVSSMLLTKVDFINPHIWFHFTVKQSSGTLLKDVMVEWLSLAGLRQLGIRKATDFAVGITYSVTYYPNRDGKPGGHLVKMVDDDGKVYQR